MSPCCPPSTTLEAGSRPKAGGKAWTGAAWTDAAGAAGLVPAWELCLEQRWGQQARMLLSVAALTSGPSPAPVCAHKFTERDHHPDPTITSAPLPQPPLSVVVVRPCLDAAHLAPVRPLVGLLGRRRRITRVPPAHLTPIRLVPFLLIVVVLVVRHRQLLNLRLCLFLGWHRLGGRFRRPPLAGLGVGVAAGLGARVIVVVVVIVGLAQGRSVAVAVAGQAGRLEHGRKVGRGWRVGWWGWVG